MISEIISQETYGHVGQLETKERLEEGFSFTPMILVLLGSFVTLFITSKLGSQAPRNDPLTTVYCQAPLAGEAAPEVATSLLPLGYRGGYMTLGHTLRCLRCPMLDPESEAKLRLPAWWLLA